MCRRPFGGTPYANRIVRRYDEYERILRRLQQAQPAPDAETAVTV